MYSSRGFEKKSVIGKYSLVSTLRKTHERYQNAWIS
jgi:hypothetical protein